VESKRSVVEVIARTGVRWGGLLTVALCSSCLAQPANGTIADPEPDGHVYLAQLVTGHPLYPDLIRLEKAIQSLSIPEEAVRLHRLSFGDRLRGDYVGGPIHPLSPVQSWQMRADELARRLALTTEPGLDRLPPDLAASLRWRQAQAQRQTALELLRAESQASRERADAAVELYGRNRERLHTLNVREDPDAETPDKVRAELEAQLQDIERKHQLRLEKLEKSLSASVDARAAQAERSVWRQARSRVRPLTGGTGEALAQSMIAGLRQFTLPDWLTDAQVSLPAPDLPESFTEADLETIARERGEARLRMAQTLARRRNEITRQIESATRLAAEKVARERKIRLQFSPAGNAVGPDMTQQVGQAVRKLWKAQTR